ncbi:FAD-dependent monooxygenase [Geodermatophilus amargosae]|uniref:FAD-dependent monooxygenase n=1 Tax=Geodermatophilus amargosae TaxID=1296565 RepID=UPI0034DF617C
MDDVLVVGAGPVGLVAACELARQGVRARIVDPLERPTDQSRAVLLHARSQELLAALGALDRVEAASRRITGFEVRAGGRALARMRLDDLPTRYPWALDVPQSDTEAALGARAAELGVTVERGTGMAALTQDADGVEVTLRSATAEERVRVGWVVAADGAHSPTRKAVGTALSGSFSGQHFVFADVDAETDLSPDTVRMFAHPEGISAVFPLPGDRVRLLFLVDRPGTGETPTPELVQSRADRRMEGRVAVRRSRWLTYFEVHHGQVPRYRHGRVLLAGDAAHIHSPAGGQGMNTGIQDAANLAWKLALVARGRARADLLDSYDAERRPVGAAVIRGTTALTTMGTLTGARAVVRNTALHVAASARPLTDAAAARLAELTVAYPDSPIVGSRGRRAPSTARPGTHAPDPAGLVTTGGAPVRIGDLLRRPGHLLLARTDDRAVLEALRSALGDLGTVVPVVPDAARAGADEGAVVDPGDVVGRAYGTGDDGLVLVRPDGYVGFTCTPADPAALAEHLRDVVGIRGPGAPAPGAEVSSSPA